MTMAVIKKSQEEEERIIFRLFVEAAQLPVLSGSIRNEPPPAPDILCEIQERGPVAFELVEIVTPALVQEMENGQKLKKAFANEFNTACEGHPEITNQYRDTLIHVGFRKGTTIKNRLSVVPEVTDALLQHSENSREYIPVPPKLRKVVCGISVHRGVSDGPKFDLMDMTRGTEEIFEQIGTKCNNSYSRNHPIELLAYYITQPSSDEFNWQSDFHDYVLRILPDSPFKRVWVYDNSSRAIKYVYPKPLVTG